MKLFLILLCLASQAFALSPAEAVDLAKITSLCTPRNGTTPKLFFVRGRSMNPAYTHQTILLLEKVELKDLKVGDVISFTTPSYGPQAVTHRIVAIKLGMIQTKGDGNFGRDPEWLTPDKIDGRVYATFHFSP